MSTFHTAIGWADADSVRVAVNISRMMRKSGGREMSVYDSRTKLEALRDHFETFSKGANYLLVGHGAGLVGCLSVVKEHPDQLPSHIQGIGQLVLLFGSGLLLGVLFWGMSMVIKISVMQSIISQKGPSQSWLLWLYWHLIAAIAYIGLWGSLVAFVVAIVLIMSRFTDAIPRQLLAWF
jgi:hypothetical protein